MIWYDLRNALMFTFSLLERFRFYHLIGSARSIFQQNQRTVENLTDENLIFHITPLARQSLEIEF